MGSTAINASYTVTDRYITSLGVLRAAGSTSFAVEWYPVEAGKSYLIAGNARVAGNGQALVCFDSVYNSDVYHACSAVVQLATTVATDYNLEYKASSNGYLVIPAMNTVSLTVSEITSKDFNRITRLEDSIENVIVNNENILEGLAVRDNTIYNPDNATVISNNNGRTYPKIEIKSGTTYYFKALYAYFCVIEYDGVETLEYLSTSTAESVNGSFTAAHDGKLGITTSKTVSAGFLFTDSEKLYKQTAIDSFYTVEAENISRTYWIKKDGTGDFDSLVDGLEEACKYMDSTVYVGPGTWDIVDELGQSYIDSVSASKPGIILKNRVHVIFSSNAYVVCNYTGTRADTILNLSAFNAGPYGFTLENANIQTKNCRYCVHDERSTNTDTYKNHYINCIMSHDNTLVSGASRQGMIQCIGGGLGADGHVIVEGCVFKNVNTIYDNAYCPLVSYHNTAASSGKSTVEIKGNYLVGRYSIIRGTWHGTSTDITQFIIHDNSLGYQVQHRAETSSDAVENTVMYEWNNEIRQN